MTLRLDELNSVLSSENVTANLDTYRKLTREHAEITPVVDLYKAYRASADDLQAAQEMAADPAMREFAEAEILEARARLTQLEADLQTQLLPKDPNDDRNCILEIRAGTGGDEAAIFAGDLWRMYQRFCDRKGLKVTVMDVTEGTAGGYKEVISLIEGSGVYGIFKYCGYDRNFRSTRISKYRSFAS